MTVGENWAGNYRYQAQTLVRAASVNEVQDAVASARHIRALGSRHSFTAVADGPETLLSLDAMAPRIEIDAAAQPTVTVSAGLRYGDVATALHAEGWALHNLASLPHISIAGAIATGTHGSGDGNKNLSGAVAGLELVTASGEILRLRRGDADFDGSVVALGALGIATAVTLDIEPTFDVRQTVYSALPWATLLDNFDAVTSSAYSVSVFTNWLGDAVSTVWLKSRTDAAAPPTTLFGAPALDADTHMIPGQPAGNTTPQGGVAGPWSERLAHFKLGFTPSNGDEIQSEYLVPRSSAVAAIEAVRSLGERIAPLLLVSEIRTMAADSLWLSGAYRTDAVGLHFTWRMLPAEVAAVLPAIEERLLPLGARPHWGKVFAAGAAELAPLYPRLADFRALAARLDPARKFGNDYLAEKLGL